MNSRRLRGFDSEAGQVVYAGGGPNDVMGAIARFQTAIVARGAIYVRGNDRLYAFTTK